MKAASDIANSVQPSKQRLMPSGSGKTSDAGNRNGMDEELRAAVTEVWNRMAQIYGHRWTSSFGRLTEEDSTRLTDTAKTWAAGIQGLTPQQLKHGFRAMVDMGMDWPPTLPEFRRLCKAKSDANRTFLGQNASDPAIRRLTERYLEGRPALPPPGDMPRTPEEHVQRMRAVLGCRTTGTER